MTSIKPLNFFGRLKRPGNLYYFLALVLFFVAINAHVLFLDSTLMPRELGTPTDRSAQNREVSKSFTADAVGTTALLQFDQFAFHEISSHSIPYWNPYTLLGMPFLAEYQWGIFYPPSYLRMLLPEHSWDYYSYLHILLLSIIVFFLSKKLYADRRGSFIAAISVFCTGFFLSYLPTYTIINVIPWGFLLILSIEGLIRYPRNWYSSLGVALAVYCLGTAGHPTLAIFMTMGAFFFFAFRVLFERSARRAFLRFLVMSLVGVLLAAPNLGPFLHYVLGSEGSVVTQWWEKPPFYSLRHFASFVFPYLFGSMNDSAFPSITSGMQPNSGFFWGTPPILFLAFIGTWFAVKNRLFALLSLALSGLVLSLWGFGIPPFSITSSMEILARLNPSYVWSFPAVVICVLAGYGVNQLRKAPIINLRAAIWTYSIFMVLMLLYVTYLGMGLDLGKVYTTDTQLALLQGLIPGLLWSLAILSIALVLVSRFDSAQTQKSARTKLTWGPIILAIGLSGVGYFPSGNPVNHAIISIGSFIAFIVFVIVYFVGHKWRKKGSSDIGFALITLICIGGWSSTLNYLFPGLPNRYVVSIESDYIEQLSKDRLNWRSYGVFGEILTNTLTPYRISTLNNQNALAPIELRQFFRDYLDSYQDTTMFYGVKYNTAADGEPMNQFHIHRKFWDYVGTKYLLFPSMLGEARKELYSQLNGYEAVSFEGAHPTPIPSIEGSESPASSFLVSKIDCSNGPFKAFRIRLSTYGLTHTGWLLANIFGPGEKLLGTSIIDASKIRDNEIHTFIYDHDLCEVPNSVVTLGLGLKTKAPHALATWHTEKNELIFSRVYPQSNGVRLITSDDSLGVRVYENTAAMPRAYLVNKLDKVGDWRSAQAAFSKQRILRDTAFVEESVTCPVAETKPGVLKAGPNEIAEVTKIESSEIQIHALVNQPTVLVLVDTFAPGWIATVNGFEVPIFRVNGLFRGVCLPNAGAHRVSMQYRPPYWQIFTFLPITGVLILALLISMRIVHPFGHH